MLICSSLFTEDCRTANCEHWIKVFCKFLFLNREIIFESSTALRPCCRIYVAL